MRHVPIALYIDTSIFKSQGLRLDTKQFSILKDTFVQGGLRLLVPAMMERELLRHYQKRASEVVEALEKVQRIHPINHLFLGDIPSKETVEEKCFNQLKDQWDTFKEHFTVELLPFVGNLWRCSRLVFSDRTAVFREKIKRVSRCVHSQRTGELLQRSTKRTLLSSVVMGTSNVLVWFADILSTTPAWISTLKRLSRNCRVKTECRNLLIRHNLL